jgi:ribosomal protein L40E
MFRLLVAWFIIFLGLAGIVGGVGMGYMASMIDLDPNDRERADFGMGFQPDNARRPKKSVVARYAAPAASVAVGGILFVVGMTLRPVTAQGSKKKKKKKADSQECARCGALSPWSAKACYHCGEMLHSQ